MIAAAVVRKELRQLSRDPQLVAVLLLLPAFLLLFYGYVLSFDVRHVSLAVLDHDRSEASRTLVETLTSAEYFDLVRTLTADTQVRPALQRGEASIVLVVPPDFSRTLEAGRSPAVQAIIDGSNASLAQTALGYVEGFVTSAGAHLVPQAQQGELPIESRLRVLYNPDLASDRFLLPGLVGFILMISATMATALSIVKERETGTIEQLLVSPLSPMEVMLGKAVPYAGMSLLAGAVVLASARIAFGLEVQGNMLLLLVVTLFFVASAQGLGLLISSITSSQQVAFQAASFTTMLPALLLSGFIFPIRSMPLPIQAITYLVPSRYYVTALRGIILKGVGLEVLWPQVLALALFAAATIAAAAARLRRARL